MCRIRDELSRGTSTTNKRKHKKQPSKPNKKTTITHRAKIEEPPHIQNNKTAHNLTSEHTTTQSLKHTTLTNNMNTTRQSNNNKQTITDKSVREAQELQQQTIRKVGPNKTQPT